MTVQKLTIITLFELKCRSVQTTTSKSMLLIKSEHSELLRQETIELKTLIQSFNSINMPPTFCWG